MNIGANQLREALGIDSDEFAISESMEAAFAVNEAANPYLDSLVGYLGGIADGNRFRYYEADVSHEDEQGVLRMFVTPYNMLCEIGSPNEKPGIVRVVATHEFGHGEAQRQIAYDFRVSPQTRSLAFNEQRHIARKGPAGNLYWSLTKHDVPRIMLSDGRRKSTGPDPANIVLRMGTDYERFVSFTQPNKVRAALKLKSLMDNIHAVDEVTVDNIALSRRSS